MSGKEFEKKSLTDVLGFGRKKGFRKVGRETEKVWQKRFKA
jgi:hypothetical protein